MASTHKEAALLKAANELLVANNTVTTLELKVKLRKDASEFYWDQNTVSTMMASLAQQNKFSYADNGTYRVYSGTPAPQPVKRGRGRPRKITAITGQTLVSASPVAAPAPTVAPAAVVKRGRGRPRKNPIVAAVPPVQAPVAPVKRGRGRPRKNPLPVQSVPVSVVTPTTPVVTKKPSQYISHTKALELMENNKGHFFTAVFIKKDQTERVMNCKLMANQVPDRLGYIKVKEASLIRQGKEAIRNVNLQTLKALSIGKVEYKIR